jgi:hypothetical protein
MQHTIGLNQNIISRTYLKNEKMTYTLPECHVFSNYYDITKRII